ncbi:MAG: M28 family peptidase, partial [Myxococcota bacterium]
MDSTLRDRWLVGAALALGLAWVARFQPPSQVDPAFRRVLDDTTALLGPDPRPVGSIAHDRARARLRASLTALGGAPTEHPATVCRRGSCARVVNLIARFGPPEDGAIAVVAHYDSVGAGPGAADDGTGVAAALAIARRYRDAPPARPVWVVLTDGEELGFGVHPVDLDGDGALDLIGASLSGWYGFTVGPGATIDARTVGGASLTIRSAIRSRDPTCDDALAADLDRDGAVDLAVGD